MQHWKRKWSTPQTPPTRVQSAFNK